MNSGFEITIQIFIGVKLRRIRGQVVGWAQPTISLFLFMPNITCQGNTTKSPILVIPLPLDTDLKCTVRPIDRPLHQAMFHRIERDSLRMLGYCYDGNLVFGRTVVPENPVCRGSFLLRISQVNLFLIRSL